MLDKKEKIRQAKEAIVYILSILRKVAPWLDQSQLKIGRDKDLLGDNTTIHLFFQQCLKLGGVPTTLDDYGWRKAVYYKEALAIYNTVRQLNKNPQIKIFDTGTYSGSAIKRVPDWQPKSKDDSYYGISFKLIFTESVPGEAW